MSIINFTVEEINIIAIYKEDTRTATLARIAAVFPYMDGDIKAIAGSASRKLDALTEPEFSECFFLPVEDIDEL